MSQTLLIRIDGVELSQLDLSVAFERWLANLVDTVNEDLSTIENSFFRGTVTLSGGTATVLTNQVNTGDSVFLSMINAVNPGFITTTIMNGVSFTLTSSNGVDGSTYSYMIVKF